jgi:uncharacterized membrane protein
VDITSRRSLAAPAHKGGLPWLGDPTRCVFADSLLIVLAVTAVAVSLTDTHSVVRLLLVLAAACLIPGSAVLTRLPRVETFEALTLALPLGLCIEAVGSLAMIWTGWWHPFVWSVVLVTVACLALALDIRHNLLLRRSS